MQIQRFPALSVNQLICNIQSEFCRTIWALQIIWLLFKGISYYGWGMHKSYGIWDQGSSLSNFAGFGWEWCHGMYKNDKKKICNSWTSISKKILWTLIILIALVFSTPIQIIQSSMLSFTLTRNTVATVWHSHWAEEMKLASLMLKNFFTI